MESRLLVSVTLFVLMIAACSLARAEDTPADDAKEVKAYLLTMDKVNKLTAATKSLRKIAATDRSVCAVMAPDEADQGKSLTDRAKKMEAAHPKVVPMLKAEGLTAREILVLTFAQMQAGMAVYVKSMGMKEVPMDVNPANVTFMEQNKKELDAIQADLKKVPDPCGQRQFQFPGAREEE